MFWLRRLLRQFSAPVELKSSHSAAVRYALRVMPTVKFDPSSVSKSVKANLRRNIELLDDLDKQHVRHVYKVALRSILVGFDAHLLYTELSKLEGMPRQKAAEITQSLHRKAKAIIDRERQASLGITQAIWMYPNAPCMKDPRHPVVEYVQQDSAHRAANGKKFEISKGLFVDGKWTWPGVEEGCKCSSRPILPGLGE